MSIQRICVFCGSRAGSGPGYMDTARRLGKVIAEHGMGVVYGGATVGMMGVVANAALEAGGQVIGVIPRFLVDKEIAHGKLSQLFVVESMHERKAQMVELSDAFIALPGGSGTLDEFFEVFTWSQLGFHHKPLALVNVNGYYEHLLGFMDRAVADGFMPAEHRTRILVRDDPDSTVAAIKQHLCQPD